MFCMSNDSGDGGEPYAFFIEALFYPLHYVPYCTFEAGSFGVQASLRLVKRVEDWERLTFSTPSAICH